METSLILAMISLLASVVGYFGTRIMSKQDEALEKINTVKDELHKRVNHVDMRVVRLETLVYGE